MGLPSELRDAVPLLALPLLRFLRLVPSLILSYLLGLCVQFQGTKDPCFLFPRPTLQTSSTLPSLPQFSLLTLPLPFFMVWEESVSGGRAVVLLLGGPPDAVFLMETSNQERHPPTHPPSPWAEGG